MAKQKELSLPLRPTHDLPAPSIGKDVVKGAKAKQDSTEVKAQLTEKFSVKKFLLKPVVIASILSIYTILIIIVANPQWAHKSTNRGAVGQLCPLRVLGVGLIVFAVGFLLPKSLRFQKKIKSLRKRKTSMEDFKRVFVVKDNYRYKDIVPKGETGVLEKDECGDFDEAWGKCAWLPERLGGLYVGGLRLVQEQEGISVPVIIPLGRGVLTLKDKREENWMAYDKLSATHSKILAQINILMSRSKQCSLKCDELFKVLDSLNKEMDERLRDLQGARISEEPAEEPRQVVPVQPAGAPEPRQEPVVPVQPAGAPVETPEPAVPVAPVEPVDPKAVPCDQEFSDGFKFRQVGKDDDIDTKVKEIITSVLVELTPEQMKNIYKSVEVQPPQSISMLPYSQKTVNETVMQKYITTEVAKRHKSKRDLVNAIFEEITGQLRGFFRGFDFNFDYCGDEKNTYFLIEATKKKLSV